MDHLPELNLEMRAFALKGHVEMSVWLGKQAAFAHYCATRDRDSTEPQAKDDPSRPPQGGEAE